MTATCTWTWIHIQRERVRVREKVCVTERERERVSAQANRVLNSNNHLAYPDNLGICIHYTFLKVTVKTKKKITQNDKTHDDGNIKQKLAVINPIQLHYHGI